jgi:2-hydroxychromene-2-carboxylate isomerase
VEAVVGLGRRVSLRSKLRSRLVTFLFSAKTRAFKRRWAERRRRLSGKPHTVTVFLELDDPYSYLLSRHIPDLQNRYDIELEVHLTQALGEGFRPHADMLAVYAEADCARLAREMGLPFLDKGQAPPVEPRRALIDALAGSENKASFDEDVLEAIGLYWRGDAQGVARRVSGAALSGEGDLLLQRSQEMLVRLGHYNTATINYAGEWYWGVDRLHYLTDRLDALGVRKADASASTVASVRQIAKISLPVSPPSSAQDLPPLEMFYSISSPYSYLALQRVCDIADAFNLELKIRPVLPMVMRGMQVPKAKLLYIAGDVTREAEQFEVPFGKFNRPLGIAAERCLATFLYALGEKKGRDFLRCAGEAIWTQAVDIASDKGLRKITGRTGLFWPEVKAAIENDDWRQIVEENRASMMASGSWGVPTLRLANFTVWGQDRLWLLVRHIEEQCDTGDGILI